MDREFPPLHTIHEARAEQLDAVIASLFDRIGRLEAENAHMASALSDTREQLAAMRAAVVVAPKGWRQLVSFVNIANPALSICTSVNGKWGWGEAASKDPKRWWTSDVADTAEEAAKIAEES